MFSKKIADELKYYVYRLIDPRSGVTFYVGNGARAGWRVSCTNSSNWIGSGYTVCRFPGKAHVGRTSATPALPSARATH
jgi:hypothetical protein